MLELGPSGKATDLVRLLDEHRLSPVSVFTTALTRPNGT